MKKLLSLVLLAFAAVSAAQAQDFPTKPVHIVVPYPPGGGADIHARVVADKLAGVLGQSVIVENRAGASGNIGAQFVARAAPDGHTLLLAVSNLVINPAVQPNQPVDALKDFTPVAITLTAQNLLLVNPSLPVKTLREFIDYAKANPGKLSYGSTGIGTPLLAMELLKAMAKLDIVQVNYKGDAPALTDLIGGQIQAYAGNIAAVEQQHRSGKLRGLAVTSRQRAESLPDVPTIDEAGVPGYELETWFGFVAPAGTPRPVVDKLNAAINRVIAMPDVRKRMQDSGFRPFTAGADEFGAKMRGDLAKFTELVKSAGIKVE
ncbi:MAG: Bug family tripartite tricarboxylate transporter substrate binding protein [Lautropia sp.]